MERSELDDYLRADLYRYNADQSKLYFVKAVFSAMPAFRYTYFLRYASVFSKKTIRGLIYRVILRHYSYKYGYQLSYKTKIGKGLFIFHRGPVVINEQAELGDNCTLAHLVTIGQVNRGKRRGCPKIGNRVFIGAGAVIVGKIVIGDDVLIAPNAYVNFDVPGNSIVVGNPARCFPDMNQHTTTTEGYVNFIYPE